jgi:DNA-binding NtrC family response regulator
MSARFVAKPDSIKDPRQEKITLAAVDDDPDLLALVSVALGSDEDLELLILGEPLEALEVIRRKRPQIVLVDLVMPGISGMDLLERIVQVDPATDVILMTAFYSTESAVEAIRKGACDYLNKPFTGEQLRARVSPLVSEARRRRRAWQLDAEMLEACCFEGIVGRSPVMHEVFARIRRVSPYFKTILITGATGTGKELAAMAIHRLSRAAPGPFVVCNCAAIPEGLLESELFGHVRGAFTSATNDKAGLFEAANGGTLFLDEIGELSSGAQAKVLRAVERQEVQRVGSTVPRKVDVRIVCATNRDLRREVERKNFREDLLFRISTVEIRLPSLAERREDLPLLVKHFTDRFARQYSKAVEGVTRRAETAIFRHAWTGNVRELENVISYGCMITDSTRIDACDLPESFSARAVSEMPGEAEMISLDELERLHARRVLDAVGGDKLRAAGILGVSRATLYRLLGAKAAAVGQSF